MTRALTETRRAVCASMLLFFTKLAYAQAPQNGADDGGAACGACCGTMMGSVALMAAVVVVTIFLQIALMVWVARDAKSRGMDSAVLWMVLVGGTSFIGLILYVFSRPQGQMRRCEACGNSRLAASKVCPHCGNA